MVGLGLTFLTTYHASLTTTQTTSSGVVHATCRKHCMNRRFYGRIPSHDVYFRLSHPIYTSFVLERNRTPEKPPPGVCIVEYGEGSLEKRFTSVFDASISMTLVPIMSR